MEIITIPPDRIETVKPLWEALNRLHHDRSTHFRDHFAVFTFEQRLAQFNSRDAIQVFAARKGETLIGYCIASAKDSIGEIDSIYVKEAFRSTGAGDALMAEAEAWLNTLKIDKIHISVAEGNESVFGFYRRHGYRHRFSVLEKHPD